MGNFIRNIFSLEERRASTIMISYIAFSAIGVYLLFKTGNIPSPLSYIVISLAGIIAGVNIAPSFFNEINQSNLSGSNNTFSNIKNSSENGSI